MAISKTTFKTFEVYIYKESKMIYIITILHYIIIIQNNIVIFFLLFIKSFGLLKALFLGDFKVVFLMILCVNNKSY